MPHTLPQKTKKITGHQSRHKNQPPPPPPPGIPHKGNIACTLPPHASRSLPERIQMLSTRSQDATQ